MTISTHSGSADRSVREVTKNASGGKASFGSTKGAGRKRVIPPEREPAAIPAPDTRSQDINLDGSFVGGGLPPSEFDPKGVIIPALKRLDEVSARRIIKSCSKAVRKGQTLIPTASPIRAEFVQAVHELRVGETVAHVIEFRGKLYAQVVKPTPVAEAKPKPKAKTEGEGDGEAKS